MAVDSPSSDATAGEGIPPAWPERVSALRAALRDAFDWAGSEQEQWNALVALAAYELAAFRGLRPTEVFRLRACDVSLRWDVILVPHPKATRRGADSRVVHMGPYLRQYLEPLVRALRYTRQDDAPLLSEWTTDAMQPLRPTTLLSLAARLIGRPAESIPELGIYRRVYATRREQLDSENGRGNGQSYIRFRRSSASMGHGQSGGWTIHLPNRFDDERRLLAELDRAWAAPETLTYPLVLPPAAKHPGTVSRGSPVAPDWGRAASNRSAWSLTVSRWGTSGCGASDGHQPSTCPASKRSPVLHSSSWWDSAKHWSPRTRF